jgi:phenylalanyl-tRNA synthetase beta chain
MNDIKVKNSPQWLQKRLLSNQMNPLNNVVDLTNYSIIEWGQPLHVYDLDKIKALIPEAKTNLKLGIRNAHKEEKFKGLDNNEYILSPTNHVITANNIAIAIAGVIGGEETAIDENTTNILLECGNFNAKKVRQSSKLRYPN